MGCLHGQLDDDVIVTSWQHTLYMKASDCVRVKKAQREVEIEGWRDEGRAVFRPGCRSLIIGQTGLEHMIKP